MSQSSPILSLPYLQPSQAQKHVTHNEALETLDLVVQLSVESFDGTVPPAAPEEGEVHVPATGATGDWAGRDAQIAIWRDAMWQFLTPLAGWRAWDGAADQIRVWDGSDWIVPTGATDGLPGVGVGTLSDATNVLAVQGPASLLTHDGAGHQLKVNKAAAGDTASLLFQSGWTGHAEMGLAGSTDFSVKVSANGAVWENAMLIDAATARAGFGADSPAARVHVRDGTGQPVLRADATDPGFAGTAVDVRADRSGDAAFEFARFSSSGQGDAEFVFSGDGNGTCDGSWTGGGADYAEYFEWADGNPDDQDRRGIAVVLDGNRIRPAATGEEPVGVVSANPSVVGDGDIGRWKGKYLRDAFGGYLYDQVEMLEWTDGGVRHVCAADEVPEGVQVPEDAVQSVQTRHRLNPDFVPGAAYLPRAERPEWAMIGLMGKLRLRKGQPVAARWIRMRRVTDEVEEWLVR